MSFIRKVYFFLFFLEQEQEQALIKLKTDILDTVHLKPYNPKHMFSLKKMKVVPRGQLHLL